MDPEPAKGLSETIVRGEVEAYGGQSSPRPRALGSPRRDPGLHSASQRFGQSVAATAN